ncbi:UNVERIFIED_CONTAM: hypothetical protein Sangu_2415900 [Sesamum angustifolium]|uniref:Uncharacterized protein n=1 Tax=Sesamum angustifolium TaxID=2727405 RepID=A0AAW2KYR0_9LAMI
MQILKHRATMFPLLNGVPVLAMSEMTAMPLGIFRKTLIVMLLQLLSRKKPTISGKKHKKSNIVADDGLIDVVNTFCDTANQHLSEISKKLFVDYDEVEKRSAVYVAVGSIPGIDLNDHILISDRLVENPNKMDLFFSLPDDVRARMVGLMLSGKV